MSNSTSSSAGCGCLNVIPAVLTATVGHHLHHSIFWTVIDFLFWPVAILKWLIFQEVNLSLLKETFAWFFR